MELSDISRLRLARQQVSVHDFNTPGALVSWMGAMQAQDYNMVRWAVAVRLGQRRPSAIQDSIDRGEIIRTHVLRPTWHLVSRNDVRWMLDLSAPHLKASSQSRNRELGLTPAILKRSLKVLDKALSKGEHLTRDEVVSTLQKSKIDTTDQRASHILFWAELEKVLCSGASRAGKNTYALFDQRVEKNTTLTRDEALMNLATRYLDSHGPATVDDFINWSALPRADGRKAIEFAREGFVSEKIGSNTFYFKDAPTRSVAETSVYLLPAFDEFVIGYKDRSACLPANRKSAVISINGIFWPVIVINGTVTGLWKRTVVKDQAKVELNFFSKRTITANKALKPLIEEAKEHVRLFFTPET